MSTPRNYIPDTNKFKLAGPPDWFLRRLWEYDPDLVIVPSRQGFYYRLALRRQLRLPENIVNEALFQHSDTQMLSTYSLVPLTTILATANWDSPLIFQELTRRAPWRMGGAEAVQRKIEEQEAAEALKTRQENDAMLTDLAKDSWGMYNKKIGVRSKMWSPKTKTGTKPSQASASIKTDSKTTVNPKVGSIFLP